MERKVCLDNNIYVRLADASDILTLFEFVDSYNDGLEIDRTVAKNSLRDMVYIHGVLLFEYQEQVIGGTAGYIMQGTYAKDVMFSAMFFYIKKEFRFLTTKVIKEIELTFLPTEVNKLIFAVPAGKKAAVHKRFMQTMGFKELETHMIKRI